jgi:low affinity Fe/Cu permease
MSESHVSETGLVARLFTGFANATARITGRPLTFAVCIALIAAWALTGPVFDYSDTWQLIINTSTTIVTFLMVFLIQNTQNRDNAALQAKLDELIRVTNAKNGFIGIEKLTDKELQQILEDFEEHATPLPLGEKSELINRKAEQVRARKARSSKSGNGNKRASPQRKGVDPAALARAGRVR